MDDPANKSFCREQRDRGRKKKRFLFLARGITDAAAWKKEGCTDMAQDEKTKGRKKRSTKMLVVFSCFWRLGTLKYLDIYPKKRRKIWKTVDAEETKRLMGGRKNNSWHEKKKSVSETLLSKWKINSVSLAAAMREDITKKGGLKVKARDNF